MAKRGNGEGSYYHILPVDCGRCPDARACKKKDVTGAACSRRDQQERWCYQYTVVNADGKKSSKRIYAKTKKALQARVERMQMESGEDYRKDITVGGWLDYWQVYAIADTVQPSTATFYRSLLKYVPESLRRVKLDAVTPVMLQTLFSDLLIKGRIKMEGPLAVKTVRSLRTTLVTAMEAAIDNGYIIKNPVKKTKPPVGKVARDIVFLQADEIKRLLKLADSGKYHDDYGLAIDDIGRLYLVKCYSMSIRLALATGMRWGEVFGLAWSDVDFVANSIYIHSNLQHGELKDTKTQYSIRYVTVDEATMRKLRQWKDYQAEFAETVGDLFNNELGLVFTISNGKPVRYDNFRMRCFDKLREKAKLPEGCTFHSLRHTHATQLLRKGINPKVISKRLGHSSVGFSLKVYAHVVPEMDKEAADAIAGLLEDD